MSLFLRNHFLKKSFNKLCEACNFLIYGGLIGKVDGCPMGGPISVVLSNRFRVKMEFDIVKPLTPKTLQTFC